MNRMALPGAMELKAGPGFILGPTVSDPEIAWLRRFVEAKWRGVLTAKYPQLAEKIAATPITAYHKIAPLIDHAGTWVKDARLFTRAEVDQLMKELSVFAYLRNAFGPYEVADIEHLGHAEIYWRLVRPNHPDDVAGAHADSWFYTVTNEMPAAEQRRIVKVWFPVFSEPGLSGLSVAADSHKLNLAYTGEMRHGRMKPLMTDPRAGQIELTPLPLSPGQCVAFHVDLLHRGIGHQSDQTRVSIEFAIRLETPGAAE
jgi:hypothetical protein